MKLFTFDFSGTDPEFFFLFCLPPPAPHCPCIWSFPAKDQIQGSSHDLSHICSNAGSFTHCSGPGIEPVTQHSQDTPYPLVPKRELQTQRFFIAWINPKSGGIWFRICMLGKISITVFIHTHTFTSTHPWRCRPKLVNVSRMSFPWCSFPRRVALEQPSRSQKKPSFMFYPAEGAVHHALERWAPFPLLYESLELGPVSTDSLSSTTLQTLFIINM